MSEGEWDEAAESSNPTLLLQLFRTTPCFEEVQHDLTKCTTDEESVKSGDFRYGPKVFFKVSEIEATA